MTRSSTKELANYDPEIEKSLRLRRKGQTSSPQSIACEEMENEKLNNNQLPPHQVEEYFDEVAPRRDRILRDYTRPDHFEGESSVRRPPIVANNFEIRTGLIETIQQSCQFTGDVSEDPHTHLIDFLELVETCRYNGVTTDAIRLRLFPFSLKGEAKTWLRSLPRGMGKISSNVKKMPTYGIQDPDILYIFYHGLKPSAKNVIDAASRGSIMGKTTVEAMQLLNEISENVVQWPSDRMIIKKTTGVNQVEALNSLTQQIATLTQKVDAFQVSAHTSSQFENFDVCQGNHPNHECQASTQNEEQVNVIGYRNNYSFGSPMAQKHPGFQWSNPNGAENPQRFFNQKQQVQGPPGFQNQNRGQQSFQQYQQQPQRAHQQSLEDLMYKFIKGTDEKVESQHQVSQLATLMFGKIQGALPSNTEKNPKEQLKVISLRSGKSLDDPYTDREGKPQEV
ncbi:PREDICTED: uncharacterized protein LOC109220761 [Nicotiana attenuata]|uniref:uncharacterized protein LOC109220761 n=1 Tax=Nicotiana attenuata TaxID=49451 RepID=UPI0009058D61|nr:PREDICTED: uncharacterized protein LOC109220761 [Nicotiana attenuata]